MGIIINGQNDTIGPVDNSMSLLGTVSIGGTMTIEDFTNIDSVGLVTARNGLHVTGGNFGIGTDNPLRKLDILGTGRPVEIGSTNATNIVKLYNSATGRSTYNGVDIQSNSTAGGIISAYGGYLDLRTSSSNGSDATSRLRITSSGNIGIGTDNPTSFGPTLQVSGTDPALLLQDTATAVDYFGMNIASGAVNTWFDDASAFVIHTATGLSGSGLSEKLRITSGGNVGINETSPDTYLHVKTGTDSALAKLEQTATNGRVQVQYLSPHGDWLQGIVGASNSGDYLIYTGQSKNLTFYTSGTLRQKIQGDGKVIIGGNANQTANRDLSVVAASGNSNEVQIGLQPTNSSGNYNPEVFISAIADGTYGAHMFFKTRDTSGNRLERLRITSGGDIGIGTGNPDATLKVNVASGNNGVVVQNTSTANIALFGARNGDATVQIGQWGSTASGTTFGLSNADLSFIYTTSYSTTHPSALALGTVSNKPIVFATNNTERLRITSAGDVGIGTAVPITGSGYASLSLADTSGGQIEFKKFGAQTHYIWSDNNLNIGADYSGTGQNLIFKVNGNVERLRIDSSGNATFKHKVNIGASHTGGEILSLGKTSGTSYMAFHNGGANMGFIGYADQLISGGASNWLGIRSQDAISFATGGNTERVKIDNDRMTFAQNRRLRFAPNSSWGAGLNMGGNGNSSDTTYGSIALTNGNLHLDPRGGTYGSYLNWYTGSGGTYFGNGSGGQAGRIDASGNLTLSGTYPGSDLRLKENIETITGATDKIKALVGKTFTWKPESGLDSYKRYGFIAQEVQQVVPDLVKAIGSHYFDANDNLVHNIEPTESDEDRESAGITKSLTVNSEGITPILVEAMKELIAKNEALEARIAALEGS